MVNIVFLESIISRIRKFGKIAALEVCETPWEHQLCSPFKVKLQSVGLMS